MPGARSACCSTGARSQRRCARKWPGGRLARGGLAAVRAALLERQRAFAEPPGLIADGRDMGTVVFPHAALKIFLTASAEERARRRYNQLKDKDSVLALPPFRSRSRSATGKDTTRSVAPLVPAADAIVLDSTAMDADEVTDEIYAHGRTLRLW